MPTYTNGNKTKYNFTKYKSYFHEITSSIAKIRGDTYKNVTPISRVGVDRAFNDTSPLKSRLSKYGLDTMLDNPCTQIVVIRYPDAYII